MRQRTVLIDVPWELRRLGRDACPCRSYAYASAAHDISQRLAQSLGLDVLLVCGRYSGVEHHRMTYDPEGLAEQVAAQTDDPGPCPTPGACELPPLEHLRYP
jgi:hypothetical protein